MKNAVFWDIKTQFVPHRIHITSLLQSTAGHENSLLALLAYVRLYKMGAPGPPSGLHCATVRSHDTRTRFLLVASVSVNGDDGCLLCVQTISQPLDRPRTSRYHT
jgi:hypothetical protein